MKLVHSPHFVRSYNKADLRQARVTGSWWFYFKIVGDTYRLEEIKSHPK
jgi:hypothetical protein